MTRDATHGVVRRALTVPLSTEAAFSLFADGLGTWWPPESTFARSRFAGAVVEPRAGGRWLERDRDGQETPWGRVERYEPPRRLVVGWQITAAGEPEPDAGKASEVEVRFAPTGDGHARVELEHRAFDRHGADEGEIWRRGMESPQGWDGILGCFVRAAHVEARR